MINSRITDSGIIEGNFTRREVQDLVTTLRSGALPAGITYLEDRTVGPSLGQDSIESSTKAGLLSLIGVVLTMVIVYRFSGVNALFALALNVLLLFGALAYFGATLTLPGIAGMCCRRHGGRRNVLVFERIRKRCDGKTVRAAIDAGFSKAFVHPGRNVTTLSPRSSSFRSAPGRSAVRGHAVDRLLGTRLLAVFVQPPPFRVGVRRPGRVDRSGVARSEPSGAGMKFFADTHIDFMTFGGSP